MRIACAIFLVFAGTGVLAPGPGQLTPPNGGLNKRMILSLAPAAIQLAHFGRNNGVLSPQELISDPALLDRIYNLPKGSVESCLDDVLYGDEAIKIEVTNEANDHIAVNYAPAACLAIVREVTGRDEYKDIKPENMIVSLVADRDRALRINGLEAYQVRMIREMGEEEGRRGVGESGFEIHVV